MRVLVIGAGVNGSVCAAALYNAGVDVTVLARGRRYEQILDQGIVIENPFTGRRSITRVPVINSLFPEDRYDYVLVIVRRNQVAELLPVLAKNCSPNVVFMLNNAAGPASFIAALGVERVMLGFVFAAGRREGSLIRAMRTRSLATPVGELDGTLTPRLTRLLAVLRRGGFKVRASCRITDELTAHAALVVPIAVLIIHHRCDTYELARSVSDLRLVAGAMREVVTVLRATGCQVGLGSSVMLGFLPRFLAVAALRALLSSRVGEVGAGWHCSQAPDEMHELAAEVRALVTRTGLPVPALAHVLAMDARQISGPPEAG